MSVFTHRNGVMHAENVALSDIAAHHGTPTYVYSRNALEQQWKSLNDAFGEHPHLICFAVKANSNIAVLNVLAQLGSGFDIVSGGELQRVLAAGGLAEKTVFSGVAKSSEDIRMALQAGVRCLNIESRSELDRIQAIAKELDVIAPIGVRVNPDVDAKTHPYIATGLETAKFGLTQEAAIDAFQAAASMSHVRVHSMACHIGSQITELSPFTDSVTRLAAMVKELLTLGIELKQLDLGGGLGIDYQGETPPSAEDYAGTLISTLADHGIDLPIAIEPGRYIAGNAGVLLTTVEYLKPTNSKNFAIVDAGMNDIMRPSLYQAFHQIESVQQGDADPKQWEVVGPVCESSDVLGSQRTLSINEGDLLAIKSAGAYCFTMASNYNSRPRAAEVMVDDSSHKVIRQRESYTELYASETLI